MTEDSKALRNEDYPNVLRAVHDYMDVKITANKERLGKGIKTVKNYGQINEKDEKEVTGPVR